MEQFKAHSVWFVIGTQHLYGAETLRQVEQHAQQVVEGLNQASGIPLRLELKPLVKSPTKRWRCVGTRITINIALGSLPGCTPFPPPRCGSVA